MLMSVPWFICLSFLPFSPSTAFQRDASVFKLKEPFPLHEEYVTVNGIRLHCVSPGRRNPDKPLMLLVHGFPECWYSWRHQMKEFADDYDVVAVDMRGYNDSDKPVGRDQYRLSTLASDIKELVGALGHKTCTLVAHDWGGSVAWVTAGMFGEALINKLIVLALPHIGVLQTNFTSAQAKRSLYILAFQAPWIPETTLTLHNAAAIDAGFRQPPFGVKNSAAISDDDVAWFRAAALKPGAMTAMLNYYRALIDVNTIKPDEAAWRAMRTVINIPTLVLHADSDPALGPELLNGIEAAVPNSTVYMVDNCSHWIQQDYPQEVNQVMREWLEGQGSKN
eukprot:jgi/Chrzof1/2172/Cz11g04270.t1